MTRCPIARSLGADVIHQEWLGFSAQRELALRHPEVRHDWVYFVDADEWISPQLAAEIAARPESAGYAAFTHRLRLVFMNTWIRHCGWYRGSWVVKLVDRRHAKFDGSLVGERAQVDGPVGRLARDLVDEDRKGLASWLHKHVRYAELEQLRRGQPVPFGERMRRFRSRDRGDTRPLSRVILKDLVFPVVPARPLLLFLYMYVIRLGLLDGRAGLRFCFFHAWYQATVDGLRAAGRPAARARPARRELAMALARHGGHGASGHRATAGRGRGPAPARGAGDPPDSVPGAAVPGTGAPQVVELEVAFLSSGGAQPVRDPSFGVTLAWDIDLLGGYRSTVLARKPVIAKASWLAALGRWLRRQDIVVLHGHADPDTLLAVAACRLLGMPYLLRGESHPEPAAAGWRAAARHLVAGAVVRGAAGALPIGARNAAFYERYAPRIPQYRAPYSVDNDRFRAMSEAARPARAQRLAALGLDPRRPTIVFSGKLIERKRPLDVIRAVERSGMALNLLLLGDGPLRADVRGYEDRLPVRCLGFVNQSELPGWYASGDVLALPSDHEPWGLVVNEGMACGLVPVVSDAVGCAADLVRGIGEIYPAGDVDALAAALQRAASGAADRREAIGGRLASFTVTETTRGYEQAAVALAPARR